MNRTLRNILIGVGIGLLIAPMPGQELRRRLSARFQNLTNTPPQSGPQVSDIKQEAAAPDSRVASNLKDVAKKAERGKEPQTLSGQANRITEPYSPAYPEYVNPETKPNP